MIRTFNLQTIDTNLIEKKLSIRFSLDVNPETITPNNLILSEFKSGKIVDYNIKIDRETVDLIFKDWPVPNEEYILKIQTGIESIIGDELKQAHQRHIVFNSEITSLIEILSPNEYEEISSLNVNWEEKLLNKKHLAINRYYLEIAKENTFYNIVKRSHINNKQSILFSDIPEGQYYIRIRAEKDNNYGRWSEIITFIYSGEQERPPLNYEDDSPIIEEELNIVSTPPNGEVINSFIIEFDEEIDPDYIESISLTRRSI